jgi:hypothetical protein
MSINFPTFTDKEIPSPEKFNDFVQALEAKFTSGLGSAEIQWPLVAAGNLVMSNYEITGGKKIMKVVNAGDSTYNNNFSQALLDGAGGVVFIPPNTTIQADGGQIVGSNAAIIGAGPSSVLKLTDAASAGYLLRNDSMGSATSFLIANLTLDGNSEVGGDGLVLRAAYDTLVHGVTFKDFAGSALKITNNGSSGTSSTRVVISDCVFDSGADHHIQCDDGVQISVIGCHSYNCDTIPFEFVALDSSANIESIVIKGNTLRTYDEEAIRVRGGSGSYSTKWESIIIEGNSLDGTGSASGAAVEVGASGAVVQHFNVQGNVIRDAVSDALKLYGRYGLVSGNMARGAGQHGINCTTSQHLQVSDNNVGGAANVGIKADDSGAGMVLVGNNVLDCTTAIQFADACYHANNFGSIGGSPTALYSEVNTPTIPANTIRAGDVVEVWADADVTGGGTAGRLLINLGGERIGGTDSQTSTGDRAIRTTFVVTNTTQGFYQNTGFCDNRTDATYTGTFGGLDFTSDLDLTYTNTNLSVSGVRWTIKLHRGQEIS